MTTPNADANYPLGLRRLIQASSTLVGQHPDTYLEPIFTAAPRLLKTSLTQAINTCHINLVQRIDEQWRAKPRSPSRAQLAVAVSRRLASHWRASSPKAAAGLNHLANSLAVLAMYLADAGRRDEALATGEEAVSLYRRLVDINEDAYLPDLAASVHNVAIRLGEMGEMGEAGRCDEALTSAERPSVCTGALRHTTKTPTSPTSPIR